MFHSWREKNDFAFSSNFLCICPQCKLANPTKTQEIWKRASRDRTRSGLLKIRQMRKSQLIDKETREKVKPNSRTKNYDWQRLYFRQLCTVQQLICKKHIIFQGVKTRIKSELTQAVVVSTTSRVPQPLSLWSSHTLQTGFGVLPLARIPKTCADCTKLCYSPRRNKTPFRRRLELVLPVLSPQTSPTLVFCGPNARTTALRQKKNTNQVKRRAEEMNHVFSKMDKTVWGIAENCEGYNCSQSCSLWTGRLEKLSVFDLGTADLGAASTTNWFERWTSVQRDLQRGPVIICISNATSCPSESCTVTLCLILRLSVTSARVCSPPNFHQRFTLAMSSVGIDPAKWYPSGRGLEGMSYAWLPDSESMFGQETPSRVRSNGGIPSSKGKRVVSWRVARLVGSVRRVSVFVLLWRPWDFGQGWGINTVWLHIRWWLAWAMSGIQQWDHFQTSPGLSGTAAAWSTAHFAGQTQRNLDMPPHNSPGCTQAKFCRADTCVSASVQSLSSSASHLTNLAG